MTENRTDEHLQQTIEVSRAELLRQHEELTRIFKLVEIAKKEWEKTMDCVDDMVLLTDTSGNIKRCNKVVTQFLGKPYDRLLGKKWKDCFSGQGLEVEISPGEKAEIFHGRSSRWFVVSAYPVHGLVGEQVFGTVITFHDTTDLKRVTTELELTNRELSNQQASLELKNRELEDAYTQLKLTQTRILQQEKMASIGQLAAGVAHEINNPMGFISSNLATLGKYLDRLLEYAAALSAVAEARPECGAALADTRGKLKIDFIIDDTKKLIAESLDGADRVKTIVQNLKSFSRVDQAETKHSDINECLETTTNIVWNELKYKASVKKEYGKLPLTKCYPQQLNQVFMNLLVNAAHAIEKQGEITIRTWEADESIFVSVSDTGCGIAQKNIERIFEPFFTTKEVGKGTGLGLSIAYDIVKKHNGDIMVQSEPGRGTTFTVKIPIVERRD